MADMAPMNVYAGARPRRAPTRTVAGMGMARPKSAPPKAPNPKLIAGMMKSLAPALGALKGR